MMYDDHHNVFIKLRVNEIRKGIGLCYISVRWREWRSALRMLGL